MSGTNRPFKYGPSDRREFIVSNGEISIRTQNDGNGNPIYIGKAKAGTEEDEEKWQISFQTYDENNSLTSKTWAEDAEGKASTDYQFAWTQRATYTYS